MPVGRAVKRRWSFVWSTEAIPRPRLWGGWSDATHGFVTLELCDTIAGNPILAWHWNGEPTGRLARFVTWLDER